MLAAGVTFLIIGQAFANMAMVCGIFPVIGVPLIFISYGGSSMIISMAAIGLLLSVYDEEEKQQLLDAEPPENAAVICVSWAAGGGSNEAFCFFGQ